MEAAVAKSPLFCYYDLYSSWSCCYLFWSCSPDITSVFTKTMCQQNYNKTTPTDCFLAGVKKKKKIALLLNTKMGIGKILLLGDFWF